jgi:hypothetical protein
MSETGGGIIESKLNGLEKINMFWGTDPVKKPYFQNCDQTLRRFCNGNFATLGKKTSFKVDILSLLKIL